MTQLQRYLLQTPEQYQEPCTNCGPTAGPSVHISSLLFVTINSLLSSCIWCALRMHAFWMWKGSKVSWWTPSTWYLHIHSGVRSVGGRERGGASNSQNNQKLYQHCAPKKKNKYIHPLHPIYSLAIPANSVSITLKPLSPSAAITHRNIWLYSHYNQTLPAFWVQWSNHIPYIVDKYNQNYSAASSLLNLFFLLATEMRVAMAWRHYSKTRGQ